MKKLSSISVFFPAFNEEKNLPIAINQALEVLPKICSQYEIIIIDDGSTDSTIEVVKKIANKQKSVRFISHGENLGYGAALKSGLYSCNYDYICYMDSDGQFKFSQIEKFISKIDSVDIVVGYRIKRADKLMRVINGNIWKLLTALLFNINFKDVDCGFKLISRKVLKTIPKLESNGATISAELLVKAKKYGFKIAEVGLEHSPRRFGQATGGNPLHIFRAFQDLFYIYPKL